MFRAGSLHSKLCIVLIRITAFYCLMGRKLLFTQAHAFQSSILIYAFDSKGNMNSHLSHFNTVGQTRIDANCNP